MKNKLSESAQLFYNSANSSNSLQKLFSIRYEVETHDWISRNDKAILYRFIDSKIRNLKVNQSVSMSSYNKGYKRKRFSCV